MPFSHYSSLPNLISLARLLLVPIIITMIAAQHWTEACLIFILAGISDAVDGWLAKTLKLQTELGTYLDPIADKALIVSIYVALAVVSVVPATLAIIVVARDMMIIGAVVISWLLAKPVEIRPLLVSKLNTAGQIGFAALVLCAKAFEMPVGAWFEISIYLVTALTVASMGAYLAQWIRHMGI